MWQMDFHPIYEPQGALERTEPVRPAPATRRVCDITVASLLNPDHLHQKNRDALSASCPRIPPPHSMAGASQCHLCLWRGAPTRSASCNAVLQRPSSLPSVTSAHPPVPEPERWLGGWLQVPFRLTRNLQTFFTAFGVEGVFVTTLAVAAQARSHAPLSHMQPSYLPPVGLSGTCLLISSTSTGMRAMTVSRVRV